MRVLLVGNYLPDGQRSMQMYAAMLDEGLRARGHEVRLLRPPARLLAGMPNAGTAAKWAGYVDKFVLFRSALRAAAGEAEVVHLCDHSNAMYVPLIAGRPHVVTCHDLLAIRSARGHFPQNRVGATGRLFQRMITSGLQQAGSILCVSQKTRDDLERYLDVPASRLHLVPNALPWPYRPLERGEAQPRLAELGIGAGDDYFLHVGGDHWYKNRPAVIAIFAELRRLPRYARSKLVMAGSALDARLRSAAARQGVADALLEAPGVSHEELQALYCGARALLFPSLEEGFGWPILEAQACGCPVATTARPPMSEVGGGAAILIDPEDAPAAADRIARALSEPGRIREEGLRNASAHSVSAMLDGCEAIYDEARRRR